jgi:hypothetical protein
MDGPKRMPVEVLVVIAINVIVAIAGYYLSVLWSLSRG